MLVAATVTVAAVTVGLRVPAAYVAAARWALLGAAVGAYTAGAPLLGTVAAAGLLAVLGVAATAARHARTAH